MNGIAIVTVNTLDGRDGGTPILDVATTITRQQIVFVVRPCHTPKGVVMGTHDEFKGKGDAIPQSEFSLLVAREQSSSTGRPAATHDWCAIFGPSDVCQKGHQAGAGMVGCVDVTEWHSHVSHVGRVGLQIVPIPHVGSATRLVVEALTDIHDGGRVVIDTFFE
jgi:hypothetical protein